MSRALFFITLVFIFAINSLAQNKLAIDDRIGFITGEAERIVAEKLAEEGIEFTRMVDFSNRCQYYFAELKMVEEDVNLVVRDCENTQLGGKNLGSRILSSSDTEKALLLSIAMLDIVSSPGKYMIAGAGVQEIGPAGPATVRQDGALANEHDSRYFFAPSAYNLKKGELYYNSVYFLLHDIQYGIDDHFSIGMGTTVIGLPIYFTPKLSFPLGEKSALAIGDMFLVGTYGSNAVGNLAYGVYSYGGSDGNISLGAGHLYTNENELTGKTSSLVTNLSAMARLSSFIFLLTENYVMSANFNREAWYDRQTAEGYYDPIYEDFVQRNTFWYGIAGIRIVSKNRDFISWQIGLTYIVNFPGDYPVKYNSWYHDAREETNMIAFPTVSFTLKFGQRN